MNKLLRRVLLSALFFLPVEKRAAVSRWLRGRLELKKLRRASIVFVTCPKSGRTWVRIMLSRILQQRHGLHGTAIVGSTAFHRANPSLPVVFFTHDTNIGNYTGNRENKADYAGKRIVLLVRDPRDIAVSAYFQWKFRMDRQKRALHTPALERRDLSVYEFTMHPNGSLRKTIAMLNSWDAALPQLGDVLVVHYEDLRRDTVEWLRRIAEFSGLEPTAGEIEDAVHFASIENMKKMERDAAFGTSSRRFSPGSQENRDAYKVRRGKIGGFEDYFTPEQMTKIDRLVDDMLAPGYGYCKGGKHSSVTEHRV
jgi:hypothetical protein